MSVILMVMNAAQPSLPIPVGILKYLAQIFAKRSLVIVTPRNSSETA